MRWLPFLFLLLLLPTDTSACASCTVHSPLLDAVTLANPASYRLVYTGVMGLIADEYVSFISKKWQDDIADYHDLEIDRRCLKISEMMTDYKCGKYADLRSNFWHYSTLWDNRPVYTTGPSKDIINIGPIRVDNKFGFKLKNYTTALSSKWSFRLRPKLRFTSKWPFIRLIDTTFSFSYKKFRKRLFRISLNAGVDLKKMSGELSIFIEFSGWG